MENITPFLSFDTEAEEAVDFYLDIFQESRKISVHRCGDAGPGPKGSVLTIVFELNETRFVALNGGPKAPFTPKISFVVKCADQLEIDHYWERLSEGGQTNVCGWLTDKFGISWQVVPVNVGEIVENPKMFQAMLKMTRFDIAALETAKNS
jgi:predicted 3-demethylubiquinone-9 3-methyltransferase (glyoxalase superfamily)